jgi:hypothetical protein
MWSVPRDFFWWKNIQKRANFEEKNQKSPYLDNEYIERLPEQSRIFKSFYFAGWTLPQFGSFLLWITPLDSLDKIEKKRKEP